jgi:hypothetical protein
MQPILDHMARVVRPALRKYLEAEQALTLALETKTPSVIDATRGEVGLAGRQAVDVLHHLADFVLKEPSAALPPFVKIDDVRTAVDAKCQYLRNGKHVDDVVLLRDTADAFKHQRPDRPSARVAASGDVAPVSVGFGSIKFGEGKYGGVEQLIISMKNGDRRALSSVL